MLTQLRLLRDTTALILVFITWPLWTLQSNFPAIPFFQALTDMPVWLDGTLTFVMAGALLVSVSMSLLRLFRRPSSSSLLRRVGRVERTTDGLFLLSGIGLILLNQHRLQVWMYHFLILVPVLWWGPRRSEATAPVETGSNRNGHKTSRNSENRSGRTGPAGEDGGDNQDNRPGPADNHSHVFLMICLLTASIYGWSAWSKLDHSFIHSHGQTFVGAIADVVGISTVFWSDRTWQVLAFCLPAGELLIALLLLIPAARRFGLSLSFAMHALLLIAVGPWGLDHSPGVILWNVFFIIQNALLWRVQVRFRPESAPTVSQRWRSGLHSLRHLAVERAGACAVLAFVIAFPGGLVPFVSIRIDAWPAWAVYASSRARVLLQIRKDAVSRLPEELHRYLESHPLNHRLWWFRMDQWSLEATGTPIYPDARFQLGVAAAVASTVDPPRQPSEMPPSPHHRAIYETHSDRWTGDRSRHEFHFSPGNTFPGSTLSVSEKLILNWKPRRVSEAALQQAATSGSRTNRNNRSGRRAM